MVVFYEMNGLKNTVNKPLNSGDGIFSIVADSCADTSADTSANRCPCCRYKAAYQSPYAYSDPAANHAAASAAASNLLQIAIR